MDDENFEAFEKKFDDFAGGLGDRLSAMETALASEKREREDLEIRMQRLGVGNREEKGDIVPEHKAMNAFARAGAPDWSQEVEIKAMSVGSDPDGGYVVLPVMSANMTKRLFDLSPMRQLARIETITTGDAWEEPDDRDEAGAEWVGEQSPRTETDTPQLGMIRIELQEIYAKPKATQRLLDDADRDMGAWLENKLTDKFARTEGSSFVTGNGIAKPRGFLDYDKVTTADAARPAGKLQYVPSGGASGLASSNPSDVFKQLIWKLRTPYRSGATWMMNSNTASVLDQLKDGQGNYIWRTGMTAGAPSALLGYPVEIDEEMPDIAANAYPVAFGNFKQGYCIIDRPGIKLLRDPYTDRPHVVFYGYRRVGGGLTNDDAIKVLKIATS